MDLIQQIWDKGGARALGLEDVKAWPVYVDLCKAFPQWAFLIDAAITQMIYDLAMFPAHQYEVFEGRIGYRTHDSIAFNVSERYLTVFAHIKECKACRISSRAALRLQPRAWDHRHAGDAQRHGEGDCA